MSDLESEVITLETRISSIAQELQTLVLDFTLMASIKSSQPTETIRVVPGAYVPPWQLSIDRRSRQEVAAWYYGSQIFEVNHRFFWSSRIESITEVWLESLGTSHQAMVKNVRIGDYRVDWDQVDELAEHAPQQIIRLQRAILRLSRTTLSLENSAIRRGEMSVREDALKYRVPILRGDTRIEDVWITEQESYAELERFDAILSA